MPSAGDAYLKSGQTLPAPNNPLNRMQLGSFSSVFDPVKLLEQWVQWFETYGFQAIEQITGIDLSAFLPVIDGTLGALTQLFGDLNPLSGTFDPLDAVTTFIDLMVEVGASLPTSLFTELFSIFGGATNSTQATNFFTNLLSGLGNPAGLLGSTGSFDPVAMGESLITNVLNPTGLLASVTAIVNAITGSSGSLTDLASFFDFANPTNLLSPLINGFLGGTGNPLSSFVTGLLGVQSTASTASTNASSALGNWTSLFSGLPGVSTLSGFLSFLNPTTSGAGIFAPLINGVAGGTTNPLSSLISSLTGTASTASTASTNSATNATNIGSLITNLFGGGTIGSTIQTGAVPTLPDLKLPGLGTLMDALFGGITQGSVTGTDQAAVNTAAATQSSTLAAQGNLIQQVKAALSTGTPDNDDFERASLGSAWTVATSTGTVSISGGHQLHYSGTGSSAEYVAQKNDVIPVNDRMISTVSLAQAIPSYPLFTPLPYGSYIDVWVRMAALTAGNMGTRSGVVLRVYSASPYTANWTLYNVVSGSFTSLTNGSCGLVGNGDSVALEAGAGGTTRRFLGTLNGTPICDFTDTTNVTTVGASNRRRGCGGKGNSGVGPALGVADIQGWTGG